MGGQGGACCRLASLDHLVGPLVLGQGEGRSVEVQPTGVRVLP
jgi:hypothetical protein